MQFFCVLVNLCPALLLRNSASPSKMVLFLYVMLCDLLPNNLISFSNYLFFITLPLSAFGNFFFQRHVADFEI